MRAPRGATSPRATSSADKFRLRPRRRVPGHEPDPVPARSSARRARTRNLCVVGDDDQSIYRWRGADVRNIRGFRRDFPDATVVKLEQNYRSTARIVAAALARHRAVARRASRRSSGPTTTTARRIRVVAVRDERDEAALRRRSAIRERARGGHRAARDRRLLPRPRAVARPRRGAPRGRTCRTRSSAARSSSSAPRSRTRSRTCASLVNPTERRRPAAHHQHAGARHRQHDDRAARRATRRRRASSLFEALGAARRSRRRSPAPPRRSGSRRSASCMTGLQTRGEQSGPPRDVLRARAREDRLPEGARGRGHRRGRGAPREPRASSWARCATTRPRPRRAGEEPTLDGFLERVSLQ